MLEKASATIRRSIGGTSGPLYASLIHGAAVSLKEAAQSGAALSSPLALANAFTAAVEGVSALGGAKAGDRTMMDALIPAAAASAKEAAAGSDVAGCLTAAATAAQAGADSTASMVAGKGRSRYIGDRALGTADPSAQAVAIWLDALRIAAGEATA